MSRSGIGYRPPDIVVGIVIQRRDHGRTEARMERRRRERPTMRDVARLAGVGLKTVSRVVNDEPGVTPATAQRVRQAIAELGYLPDVSATSLRRADGRTGAIGIALDDVANPFSAGVLRGVEDVARRRATVVLAASLDGDEEREREVLHTFVARRVDGVIVMPSAPDSSWIMARIRPFTPVVAIDRRPRGADLDTVVATNALGASEAVAALVASGHRRIAFLGDRPTLTTATERLEGYLTALERADIALDPRLVVTGVRGTDEAESRVLALMDLPRPPTALFTAQNLITTGAVLALLRLGRYGRVALVGFDDVPLGDALRPGLTTVTQDAQAIGRTAAELLFDRRSSPAAETTVVQVPTRLVRRGSGELPPSP
jgi:LacI family transcriptional regulator